MKPRETVVEVAARTGYSQSQIRYFCSVGRLRAVRVVPYGQWSIARGAKIAKHPVAQMVGKRGWMTSKEAAAHFGIKWRTLRMMCLQGRISGAKLYRDPAPHWRIPKRARILKPAPRIRLMLIKPKPFFWPPRADAR